MKILDELIPLLIIAAVFTVFGLIAGLIGLTMIAHATLN